MPLADGEDFELLLARCSSHVADDVLAQRPTECPITRVGELIQGTGLWQVAPSRGERTPLEPRGWQH